MHAISRNRSAGAVVAVILAGVIGAWLVTTSGGDPGRTDAGPPGAAATQPPTGALEGQGGAGESASPDTGAQSPDAATSGDGKSGDQKSGDGTSGDGKSGGQKSGGQKSGDGTSGDGKSGDGTSGSDGSGDGGGTSGTTDTEADDQEPGTATGATVPALPVQTLAPVPLESVGDFETGLTVQLASISAVEAEAKAPGEIAGPALRVTVEAANAAAAAVSLDGVVVFLSYGDERTPASLFGSSSEPLSGDLASGSSRTGTYVFTVPPDQRDDVRVEVSYTGSAPTVSFTGSVDG